MSDGRAGAVPLPERRAAIDAFIGYHGSIAGAMTSERTALESALIPVTAYILVACVECYRRYPEMMRRIAAARPPAELGRLGRVPGTQIDAVHLWSIANFPLVGRQVLSMLGLVEPSADLRTLDTVASFWEPAALAFRGDGRRQAWDAGFTVPRYDDEVVAGLVEAAVPLSDERRPALRRANAALTAFLFLLYLDTRAGYQDTGPYPLDDGRVLLVRDFCSFGRSHFPWSAEVCAELPVSDLTLAFVLDGAGVRCNDWGTSTTAPVDYLACTERVGVFEPGGGRFRPLRLADLGEIAARARDAGRQLYRLVAGMSRSERIDAGAYVYFTFLRPFAEAAGIAGELDWRVPRDSTDVYDALASIEHMPERDPGDSGPYYAPLAEVPSLS